MTPAGEAPEDDEARYTMPPPTADCARCAELTTRYQYADQVGDHHTAANTVIHAIAHTTAAHTTAP